MADCVQTIGSGCACFVEPPALDCEDSAAPRDTGDTGTTLVLHGSGLVQPGCATAVGPAWLALVATLLVLVRRHAVLLLLVAVAAPRPARADDVDAELLAPGDGGAALSVHEADLGHRWDPAGALTWTFQTRPVVARNGPSETPLLDAAATGTAGGSLRIADGPRVGAAVRYHQWAHVSGVGEAAGDTALWLSVPLLEAPERGLFAAATLELGLPTGPRGVFLSDASGAVEGSGSFRWVRAGFAVDLELGVHLQRTQELANLHWGPRYRWAGALSARPFGFGLVTAEVFGSGPLDEVDDVAAVTPIEADVTLGGCLGVGLCLRAGGGGGLSYGVGSPALRAIVALDWHRPAVTDQDGDGIRDLRDRCVRDPEDVDLVQDADGCPEADADRDGVSDPADLCVLVPETRNGLRDLDGCPDVAATVVLRVVGAGGAEVETAEVEGLSLDPFTVFGGDTTALVMAEGTYAWQVRSEGFRPASGSVDAFGGSTPLTVELVPIRFGKVRLVAVTPEGAPLAAFVRRAPSLPPEPAPRDVPAEIEAAPTTWTVYAAGHAARTVQFEVRPDELLEVRVELRPVDVSVDGDRITTTRVINFDLDKAELRPDAAAVVDDIASLLASRPDIELLRIEGHADETGTSRHNLELSRARATAVVDALVARGVDRARLEALGSGEARRAADTRTVDFTVLVWGDR